MAEQTWKVFLERMSRKCQNNVKQVLTKPIYWKQGWAHDDRIRMSSSSGGVAAAIEQAFIKNGGLVCSCTFNVGKFEFDFAESEDEVGKFTGSKYVKSNPEGVYKKILENLKLGRKVLFVGLPCQVSAVRHYTRNYQNLYRRIPFALKGRADRSIQRRNLEAVPKMGRRTHRHHPEHQGFARKPGNREHL